MPLSAWGDSGGYSSCFVKIAWCLLIKLDVLCCLIFWAILAQWQDLVTFPQRKHHRKSKKSSYIYMKMQKYCDYSILILNRPGRHNVDWPRARFLPLSSSMLLSCDVPPLWRFRNYINEGKTKIEQHLFGPKYQNTIINSESMPLFL